MVYTRKILLISGISIFLVLMLGCGNYKRTQYLKNHRKSGLLYTPNDLYAKKVTPKEFLLYLKNPNGKLSVFGVEPNKIQTDWVQKTDVMALSKYLDDSTECAIVVNSNLSSTLSDHIKSTVNKEALKLINIYFTKSYLNFSSENYYSKDKVMEWIKLND